MKGFLSDGWRDLIAIISLVVGIVPLLLAFKFRLPGNLSHPTTIKLDAHESLFQAFKKIWNDSDSHIRDTCFLVGSISAITAIIVLIFNLANEVVAGIALVKDIGLAYLVGAIDDWLKRNSTKNQVYLFRGLVAASITLFLIVPLYVLGSTQTQLTRLQSLHLVEMVGFFMLGLLIIGFYSWEAMKYGWSKLKR